MGRSEHFYHGTTSPIKDGMVRPVNDVEGKHVSEHAMGDPGDMSEGDHAFAIRNHEGYAWHAAKTFHTNGMRPRVYEVEPAADMKPGPWNKEHPDFLEHLELDDPKNFDPKDDPQWHASITAEAEQARRKQHQDEWASPTGFKVKQRIDIQPGYQGTFPEVNWNRFKAGHPAYGPEMNHPTDHEIQYGHRGLTEAHSAALNEHQFGHDWHKDPAPHSPLREAAGRPQKRWATLDDA
jgi:hypothetical protein